MGKYRDHRQQRGDRSKGDRTPEDSEPNYFQRPPAEPLSTSVAPTQPTLPACDAELLWFTTEKGFGFVRLNDGSEAFLHISKLPSPANGDLKQGMRLEVRIEIGRKGPQVSEVLPYSAETSPDALPRPSNPGQQSTLDQRTGDEESFGLVKMYDAIKGFGFIKLGSSGKDIFVHATTVSRGGLTSLEVGQAVIVRYWQGQKGLEARSIRLR